MTPLARKLLSESVNDNPLEEDDDYPVVPAPQGASRLDKMNARHYEGGEAAFWAQWQGKHFGEGNL